MSDTLQTVNEIADSRIVIFTDGNGFEFHQSAQAVKALGRGYHLGKISDRGFIVLAGRNVIEQYKAHAEAHERALARKVVTEAHPLHELVNEWKVIAAMNAKCLSRSSLRFEKAYQVKRWEDTRDIYAACADQLEARLAEIVKKENA